MRSILCFAVALVLGGCAFLEKHQASLVAISRVAAQEGTSFYLGSHPQDRPFFVAAEGALTSLIDSGNYDPVEFQRALASLPVDQLNGGAGSIYLSVGVVVWDEVAQAAQGVNDNKTTAAVIKAVRDGLRAALATPATG